MQTFAVIILALLSLLAGLIIEPPAAKAAGKSKAQVAKPAPADSASDEAVLAGDQYEEMQETWAVEDQGGGATMIGELEVFELAGAIKWFDAS